MRTNTDFLIMINSVFVRIICVIRVSIYIPTLLL